MPQTNAQENDNKMIKQVKIHSLFINNNHVFNENKNKE